GGEADSIRIHELRVQLNHQGIERQLELVGRGVGFLLHDRDELIRALRFGTPFEVALIRGHLAGARRASGGSSRVRSGRRWWRGRRGLRGALGRGGLSFFLFFFSTRRGLRKSPGR